MPAQLTDHARRLLDAKSFVTLATLEADGSPQQTVVWAARDGDDVLISTVEGRRKHQNLARDPRASVMINPPDNPYTYVEIRGRASMTTEGGRELINALSHKYMGKDYDMDTPDTVRVVVRISPEKVVDRG
ncbi:PPOX class F420-dependent oxidoreductase [Streptomyces sp. RB6PN25]|uniref:PPOX class F420-dependent oxidoreductase n=1 Tax=Streptomyces humicola TaxID=2953240 RepID=A0ABT1Q2A8_9ACTN|nr:PPOX class F420-dependent oxidoreductase [Streptomyces humicola]MCQ4084009.1 PPOX class F420-dependent oxidoreductase [Streptomyces humicola]